MNTRQQFIEAIRENPDDEATRFVFADWLEENGDMPTANRLREGAVKPVRDISLDALSDDYGWGEVFGEGSGGNCNKKTDPCPPGSDVDCTPPSRADVVEVIASANGENDGPEWIGVFRLRDGRFLLAYGGCDYTGWD